jgi:hypothetical protein
VTHNPRRLVVELYGAEVVEMAMQGEWTPGFGSSPLVAKRTPRELVLDESMNSDTSDSHQQYHRLIRSETRLPIQKDAHPIVPELYATHMKGSGKERLSWTKI